MLQKQRFEVRFIDQFGRLESCIAVSKRAARQIAEDRRREGCGNVTISALDTPPLPQARRAIGLRLSH